MSGDYEKALGKKIAFNRKQRGLSQREFAALLDRSEAWVSQVERGVRRVDRMTVLEKVAGVLDVPVGELAAEAPVVAAAATGTPVANRLRLTLSSAHALNAVLGRAPEPPDLDAIRTQAERAWSLMHEGDYLALTDLLEELIPQAQAATRVAPAAERPEAFRLLTAVYHTCSGPLANMGDHDAAWIAVDRAIVAAERADDPLLMAAGHFRLSIVFLGARHYDQAAHASAGAADALRVLAETGDVQAVALRGALTLQRAVAAARIHHADAAYEHIREARTMANEIGSGRNDFHTEFGPTNVDLHEVAVAVDLGDAGHALRTAQRVDPTHLSAERQTRFHLDVARAHTQRRQVPEAVAAVRAAERLSPEIVRTLPKVRQLIADLTTISQTPSEELRSLASGLGVEVTRGSE